DPTRVAPPQALMRHQRYAGGFLPGPGVADTACAMSEENVEIIKEALAAWNRGDMDAVMSAMSDDVILDPLAGWPEEGAEIVGVEAVMERFRAVREGFERDWVGSTRVCALG